MMARMATPTISDEGLKLAAQVASTIFSAVFAIAAIVLQVNGYPLAVIIRRLRSDQEMHQAFGIFFIILATQIIGVNNCNPMVKSWIIWANPALVVAELSCLGFLVVRLIQYLETRPMAQALGRELLEIDQ